MPCFNHGGFLFTPGYGTGDPPCSFPSRALLCFLPGYQASHRAVLSFQRALMGVMWQAHVFTWWWP